MIAPASAPVRVLVNGLHAKTGGGVTYLRNILPLLAADPRLEVHLLLSAGQRDLFAPLDGRVRLHMAELPDGFWRLLAWEQLRLPGFARARAADVTFSPANFGPLFAPGPVIMLRNALAVGRTERRLAKRLYWLGLAAMTVASLLGCRRAIAVSDYARRAMGGWLPRRLARKLSVVYHGADPRFSPGDAAGRDAPPFLLAVSDIYVQKNLHSLIAALPYLRAEFPEVTLKIAGHRVDDDYVRAIERAVAAHGLAGKVEFLGRRSADELAALYRRCAAFVFPSTVETFGNPLVEAMASGAPVACSNTTAMPEIAGDAALLFDPSRPQAIAEAIGRILREPALAAALSARGIARARAFSWQETAQRTADVLVAAAGKAADAPKTREGRAGRMVPLLLWSFVIGAMGAYLHQFRATLPAAAALFGFG